MGPRGELMPKGLLRVGGAPLVQRSVELLQKRGISSVRIVTGHLCEQYQEVFEGVDGVELVHNPAFATTGSLRSLMTGLRSMQGPFVLLESDLIYERAALDPISAHTSKIIVSGDTNAGDEVYIWTRNGTGDGTGGARVFDIMSKDIRARDAVPFGELTGISCFTAKDTDAIKQAAQARLAQDPKSDYESAVVHMAGSTEIDCHLIPDLVWTEIDDEGMYSRANNVVWPMIRDRDRCV